MPMRPALLAAAIVLGRGIGQAWAKDAHCMAHIVMDVPAEEAPEQVKSKSNNEFGPITQIKVNKKTGKMTYCAANSYCYNSNAFELVTPCRIKRDTDASDATFFSYFTR
jgi:hypothetical protein